MKPIMIKYGNHQIRFLEITQEEAEEFDMCENCGQIPSIQHELLQKEEAEWCIDCNDAHFRSHATPQQDMLMCLKLTADGYAIGVVIKQEDLK